jgi:hypothetical protein
MFAAVRRRSRLVPSVLPAVVAPVSAHRSAVILAPGPQQTALTKMARCRVASLLAASGASDQTLRTIFTPEEFAAYTDKVEDAPCKFCLARETCTDTADGGGPVVTKHGHWSTDFDPDRRVTSVTVSDYEFELSASSVEILVGRANPQNWAKSPGGFFLKSEPGTWSGGRWTPGPWRPGGGDLLEQTRWQWNEDIASEIYNILRISELTESSGGISYNYSLRECVKSNFGLTWARGGMDVDNGYYTLSSTRVGRKARVKISSRKAVRYTASPATPPEFAAFVNVLASALISVLMHEFVYHVTDNLPEHSN